MVSFAISSAFINIQIFKRRFLQIYIIFNCYNTYFFYNICFIPNNCY